MCVCGGYVYVWLVCICMRVCVWWICVSVVCEGVCVCVVRVLGMYIYSGYMFKCVCGEYV